MIKQQTNLIHILVSAYGGGIRAAAFTSMSLAYLDSSVQSLNSLNAQLNYHPFEHYVFSYSGSSGGTIGNQIIPQHRTIALSTGAFLSARFPYISPSAKFGDGYHFIDAGLKDNSGAETSEQIYEAVHKLYTDSTLPDTIKTLLSKTNIFFLSISNSSKSKTGIDKQAKNVFELTAPIVALYNNWESNSVRADSTALFKYSNSGQYFRVWPDVDCIGNENGCYSPVLPLGWQISEGALRRLKNSIRKKYPTQISHPEFDKIIDSCFKR